MVVTPLFGIPMGPELVVILLIAILLFGANKIPKLARSTGQAIGEFEKGKTKAEQELEDLRNGNKDVSEIESDLDTGLVGDGESSTETDAETESSGSDAETSSSSE